MDNPPLTGAGGGNPPSLADTPPTPAAPGQSAIDLMIHQAAGQYNIPEPVLRALLMQESGMKAGAVGAAGEIGLGQFMPATAKALGIDASDPAQAIPGAAMYLRHNMNKFGGDLASGLAAYNWGPGNVAKYGFANAPPQVKNYVARIMSQKGVPTPSGAGGPGTAGPGLSPPTTSTTPLAQAVAPSPTPSGPPPVNPALLAQAQGGLASIFAPAGQDFQQATQKRVFGLA